ncbi:DUF305 domain-containing protein [Streptosporangium carneum]|uniref:Lipoprotein n=1 Tax=Streptosporangium carneum TaxID=47481 RepID=A0A9W6IBH2_9ACTN|nr:DUF305 domain-containing protein [Streptosporangium carneum]GLK14991.1 lipoprotein [Streptosporangium carneum]
MDTHNSPVRRAALLAAALGTGAALVACAPGGVHVTGPQAHVNASAAALVEAPADEHNARDVLFAQRMISHHRLAMIMSWMAETHTSNARIRALAERIRETQAPEIAQMSGWLESWGERAPTRGPCMMGPPDTRDDDGEHCYRGPDDMGPGMPRGPHMTDRSEPESLDGASEGAFDRMFLDMMISHHTDAIDMATVERQDGLYPPARALAASVITGQTAEITEIRALRARS